MHTIINVALHYMYLCIFIQPVSAPSRPSIYGVLTLEAEPPPDPAALCQDQGLMTKEMEDILNSILPPREWEEEGKIWRQIVKFKIK